MLSNDKQFSKRNKARVNGIMNSFNGNIDKYKFRNNKIDELKKNI